jgi:hypothetical protein
MSGYGSIEKIFLWNDTFSPIFIAHMRTMRTDNLNSIAGTKSMLRQSAWTSCTYSLRTLAAYIIL